MEGLRLESFWVPNLVAGVRPDIIHFADCAPGAYGKVDTVRGYPLSATLKREPKNGHSIPDISEASGLLMKISFHVGCIYILLHVLSLRYVCGYIGLHP